MGSDTDTHSSLFARGFLEKLMKIMFMTGNTIQNSKSGLTKLIVVAGSFSPGPCHNHHTQKEHQELGNWLIHHFGIK